MTSKESGKSISPAHSISSPKMKQNNATYLIANERKQQRCSIFKLKSRREHSFKKEITMRIPKEWEMHQFENSEYLNSMHYYLKRAYAVDSIIMNKKNINEALEKHKYSIIERQQMFDFAFNKYIDFLILKRWVYENFQIPSKLYRRYESILAYKKHENRENIKWSIISKVNESKLKREISNNSRDSK